MERMLISLSHSSFKHEATIRTEITFPYIDKYLLGIKSISNRRLCTVLVTERSIADSTTIEEEAYHCQALQRIQLGWRLRSKMLALSNIWDGRGQCFKDVRELIDAT